MTLAFVLMFVGLWLLLWNFWVGAALMIAGALNIFRKEGKWSWAKYGVLTTIAVVGISLIGIWWTTGHGGASQQASASVVINALKQIPTAGAQAPIYLAWVANALGLPDLADQFYTLTATGQFTGILSLWPIAVGIFALILLLGAARWVWGRTQIPAAAAVTTGTAGATGGTGGTGTPASLQDRLINLGLGLAALAVTGLVIVMIVRWSGLVKPSARPNLDADRRTLAARLVDAEEFRVYQGVDFLPALPVLDAQGNVTITVEMVHGMLISARDALIPIEQLDQRSKTPVTQDVRDYIVTWVEALTLRLNQARIDPLTVPGYLEVYRKARTLQARGLVMQGSHAWVAPPKVGGEIEKVLTLANRVATLKVWVEDLEARNADPSVPPPTLKERQEAQAEAMTILANCESSRLMLNLGAQVPFAQTYDPIYTDLLWNSRGDGLCNWAQALRDRLR